MISKLFTNAVSVTIAERPERSLKNSSLKPNVEANAEMIGKDLWFMYQYGVSMEYMSIKSILVAIEYEFSAE